jgi:uncharacterized membrane protein
MNKKIDWTNLVWSYALFSFGYSAVIYIIWNYLFAPVFSNLTLSYLQILGAYTTCRLLFGNTNTNYISNFYTQKTPDLDKIDSYLKEIEADLNKEADEVERQYEDLDKKD